MKKLWVFVLFCIVGSNAVLAQTGEVYSLNVVGFQKLTAVPGTVLVSTPFQRSPNTLDDVIGPQLTGGKSELTADTIVMWDKSSQSYRRYWLRSSDNKWYDIRAQRATNAYITPADGFWIQSQRVTNQLVVVSGDVVNDAAVTNILVPGLNLVSYPFSSPIEINSSRLTNGTGGKSESGADKLVIWDANARVYNSYWLRAADKKWYTTRGSLATGVVVGGGRGFWYENKGLTNFVWVEARPYTL